MRVRTELTSFAVGEVLALSDLSLKEKSAWTTFVRERDVVAPLTTKVGVLPHDGPETLTCQRPLSVTISWHHCLSIAIEGNNRFKGQAVSLPS